MIRPMEFLYLLLAAVLGAVISFGGYYVYQRIRTLYLEYVFLKKYHLVVSSGAKVALALMTPYLISQLNNLGMDGTGMIVQAVLNWFQETPEQTMIQGNTDLTQLKNMMSQMTHSQMAAPPPPTPITSLNEVMASLGHQPMMKAGHDPDQLSVSTDDSGELVTHAVDLKMPTQEELESIPGDASIEM